MNKEERFYRSLYRIRRVEETVARVYPDDKIRSPVHLSIGQEQVSVGICEALRRDDAIFGTYRSHASYLAKGGDLQKMIDELYGRDSGCCRGKGGSMHLVDPAVHALGGSAIVSSTIPHAAGWAYGQKIRKTSNIAVALFGDGAIEEGVFYETLNFALLKRLPLLFVCENNFYAIHSPLASRQAPGEIAEKVGAFGIESQVIEDGDIFRIHDAVSTFAGRMREDPAAGPFFLECKIYRWKEHVGIGEDFQFGYRPESELSPWQERDSLTRLADTLPPETRQRIESEVDEEIACAFAQAEKAPYPEDSALTEHVFQNHV
jgi:TPP-dependent pyruvate/acetoin dehydrogenase alpha subunit